jgi:hypothetical protein
VLGSQHFAHYARAHNSPRFLRINRGITGVTLTYARVVLSVQGWSQQLLPNSQLAGSLPLSPGVKHLVAAKWLGAAKITHPASHILHTSCILASLLSCGDRDGVAFFFAKRGQHGPTTQGCAVEGLQHLRPEGSDMVRGEPLTDKQAQADGHLHSTGRAPECPGSTPACRARRARMHLHSTWGNVVHGCQLSSGSPGAGRPLVGCGARAGSLPAALGSRSGSQPPRALAQDPGAAIW